MEKSQQYYTSLSIEIEGLEYESTQAVHTLLIYIYIINIVAQHDAVRRSDRAMFLSDRRSSGWGGSPIERSHMAPK